MKREPLGAVALVLAVTLLVAVDLPLFWYFDQIEYSAKPNAATGQVILENCHGTDCYITMWDHRVDQMLAFLIPITIVLGGLGKFLTRDKTADD